ncbi:MAG: YqeG family HAD IIIA-type phosphatase [Pirellulales bacterium]|nr:YqeG family HAD IIIA-type phosphatase [Pirellulales bacterium]
MLRLIAPHLHVDSVCDLTLARLEELKLSALLLDVDCTLKRYRDPDVSPEVVAWLDELRAGGIGLCLVSNGMGRRIGRIAERLDLPFVAKALKPFPFRLRAAVRRMHFPPQRTAMVGDQLFADVLAGRLAGLTSILVRPIHPEEEPWFTRLKRPPERYLVGRMKPGKNSPMG